MNKDVDVWITPEEALKRLGDGWQIIKKNGISWIAFLNESGVPTKQIRIYSGDEHHLAQAGMTLEHTVDRALR